MHRTGFGDPRPNTLAEIEEALMELDYLTQGGGTHARINPPDPASDGTVFQGYTAEAIDDAGIEFATAGYPDRESLVHDLQANGFTSFEDMT
jgi:hypothetical protein